MSVYSEDISANDSWQIKETWQVKEAWPVETTRRMNKMYRRQRHIYDGTRRYYLLGRDRLIAGLQPVPGANVLEIGCGTGRNLVLAARHYPDARFFGIDVSTEMLTSAIASIARAGLDNHISVRHGDGTSFDPQALFGIPSFDHVMISYSLSMIPDWRRVLEAAANRLKPGGRLHIVDFGNQERLPGIARALLLRWLRIFDVTPRDDLACVLSDMAETSGSNLAFERPFRGYAQYGVLTSSSRPAAP
jgi:S-adenosylmethionine-diacylgycerolhomoserine-N-methlytransferase